MKSQPLRWAAAAVFAAGIHPALAQTDSGAVDDAAAGELVAVQARQQGFACSEPASAKRDPTADDDAVWTLTCADAKYRVRLGPDQAAEIQKLD